MILCMVFATSDKTLDPAHIDIPELQQLVDTKKKEFKAAFAEGLPFEQVNLFY
jgi:hypothetical protein